MRLRKNDSNIAPEVEPGVLYDSDKSKQTMRRPPLLVSTIVLFAVSSGYGLLLRPSRHAEAVEHGNVRHREEAVVEENQCGIFMAPSSLKGATGFGIFTTRDIKKKESILFGQDGPSIPIVDGNSGPNREHRRSFMYWWGNYAWVRGVADQVNFEANRSVYDYQIGFGSLPNHHCLLESLDHRYPLIPYDDSIVGRGSPGVGAFSYNMGRDFFTTKDLKAGDEIFLNYGHCEREQSSDSEDWATTIPMVEDYREAATIVREALETSGVKDSEIVAPENANKYVAALLQQSSTKELRAAMESEKVGNRKDFLAFVAKHLATTPRTTEFIRKNGLCLENTVARKSLLPHAGNGAFSQYKIRKGEMIVPAPLLQIPYKDVLEIYGRGKDSSSGTQLLLNYCFGHKESTMLLCPDTSALLINHCSNRKRQCGPKGPNAEYRWSTGWEASSDDWLRMTVDEISKQRGRGVSMEVVALRDINPGEEVYIDYGEDWETAWEQHVSNYKPPERDVEPFITAKEANEQKSLQLLVTGDLHKVSEHPYLFTGCQLRGLPRAKQLGIFKNKNPSWVELSDKELLKRFSIDGSRFRGNYTTHSDGSHVPCSVIREDENGSYTVRIHRKFKKEPEVWEKNGLPRFITNFPREAIHYFVRPYASDQYLPGAFRHPIGLRDEIFPEQWKNLKRA